MSAISDVIAGFNGQTAQLEFICELISLCDSTTLNTLNETGESPLHVAAKLGFDKLISVLASRGADLNILDAKTGRTPLMFAVESHRKACFDALMSCGADANARGKDGETLLIQAIKANSQEIITELLSAGADSGITNDSGLSAFAAAIIAGNIEATMLLSQTAGTGNVEIDKKYFRSAGGQQITPLLLAVKNGRTDLIKTLLAFGADAKAATSDGRSAIELAVLYVREQPTRDEIVKILIDAGVEVNHVFPWRGTMRTALMLTAQQKYLSTMTMLVKAGADVNYVAMDGATALSIAEQIGFTSVAEYLKSVGAVNPVGAAVVSASASASAADIPPAPPASATSGAPSASVSAPPPPSPPSSTAGSTSASTVMLDLPGSAGTFGATTAGASIDELPMTPTALSRQTSSNEQLKAAVDSVKQIRLEMIEFGTYHLLCRYETLCEALSGAEKTGDGDKVSRIQDDIRAVVKSLGSEPSRGAANYMRHNLVDKQNRLEGLLNFLANAKDQSSCNDTVDAQDMLARILRDGEAERSDYARKYSLSGLDAGGGDGKSAGGGVSLGGTGTLAASSFGSAGGASGDSYSPRSLGAGSDKGSSGPLLKLTQALTYHDRELDFGLNSDYARFAKGEYYPGEGRRPSPVYVKLSRNATGLRKEYNLLRDLARYPETKGQFIDPLKLLDPESSSKTVIQFVDNDPLASPGYCALVMELGVVDLGNYLHGAGAEQLRFTQVVPKAEDVIKIISALHEADYMWLDIKPSNFVLVQQPSCHTKVKGVDVETMVRRGDTLPPDFKTTVNFLSPELARYILDQSGPGSATPTASSSGSSGSSAAKAGVARTSYLDLDLEKIDIWALGATLWEMFDPEGKGFLEAAFDAVSTDRSDDVKKKLLLSNLTQDQIDEAISVRFRESSLSNLRRLLKAALQVDPFSRATAIQLGKMNLFNMGNTTDVNSVTYAMKALSAADQTEAREKMNTVGDDGETGLTRVICSGLPASHVRALLKCGADPDLKNAAENTPLLLAAKLGQEEVVDALLESRARVDLRCQGGMTALMAASRGNNAKIVTKLLVAGADINASNEAGETCLSIAAFKGGEEVAKVLAARKSNTEVKDAAEAFEIAFNHITFSSASNINKPDQNGCTLLMREASTGRSIHVNALLKGGADVNLSNTTGHTALMMAAENGHIDIVITLLCHGAQVNAQNHNELSALMLATEAGHLDIVRVLLSSEHIQTNIVNRGGLSALALAASRGLSDILSLLLTADDAPLSAKDEDGMTPLMHAASNGHTDAVRLLLEKGPQADINAKDDRGNTALTQACRWRKLPVVRLLLTLGADPKILPRGARSFAQYLRQNGISAADIEQLKTDFECLRV